MTLDPRRLPTRVVQQQLIRIALMETKPECPAKHPECGDGDYCEQELAAVLEERK